MKLLPFILSAFTLFGILNIPTVSYAQCVDRQTQDVFNDLVTETAKIADFLFVRKTADENGSVFDIQERWEKVRSRWIRFALTRKKDELAEAALFISDEMNSFLSDHTEILIDSEMISRNFFTIQIKEYYPLRDWLKLSIIFGILKKMPAPKLIDMVRGRVTSISLEDWNKSTDWPYIETITDYLQKIYQNEALRQLELVDGRRVFNHDEITAFSEEVVRYQISRLEEYFKKNENRPFVYNWKPLVAEFPDDHGNFLIYFPFHISTIKILRPDGSTHEVEGGIANGLYDERSLRNFDSWPMSSLTLRPSIDESASLSELFYDIEITTTDNAHFTYRFYLKSKNQNLPPTWVLKSYPSPSYDAFAQDGRTIGLWIVGPDVRAAKDNESELENLGFKRVGLDSLPEIQEIAGLKGSTLLLKTLMASSCTKNLIDYIVKDHHSVGYDFRFNAFEIYKYSEIKIFRKYRQNKSTHFVLLLDRSRDSSSVETESISRQQFENSLLRFKDDPLLIAHLSCGNLKRTSSEIARLPFPKWQRISTHRNIGTKETFTILKSIDEELTYSEIEKALGENSKSLSLPHRASELHLLERLAEKSIQADRRRVIE